MTLKKLSMIFFASCLVAAGCNKKLEEHPYTVFTTEYFKTPAGLQSAVITMYANNRYNYGPNGALAVTNVGTDEWTYGDQARTGQDDQVLQLGSYLNVNPTNGAIGTPWNRNFAGINMANAVVDYSPGVSMDENQKKTLVAEARYFRAHFYYNLVTQFGAVPVDLGSGELTFNTTPFTGFNRLPLTELLGKDFQVMINDLIFASENLPDQRPTNAFRLSKAAALHMLAKVYLFRGYSEVKQGTDFENAYQTAKKLIDNKAAYGVDLLPNYGDIHRQGNDYNREVMYSVERAATNNVANEVANPGSDFSGKVNIANNMFNAEYTNIEVPAGSGKKPVDRVLQYGRPLRRYAPTRWLWDTAFADKYNDSRFENSFRVMWKATNATATNIRIGDTAFVIATSAKMYDSLVALNRPYRVIHPDQIYSNQNTALNIYPNLKKYDDSTRTTVNDVSGRPFIVSKFGETYLLAAEAAFQTGRTGEAVAYINTLRERAAYRPGLSAADLENRKAVMRITASQLSLDFILDERSRELAGESVRWPDLAMRGKLLERVKPHNPDAAPNIQPHHARRPIPRSQLDLITAEGDKNIYQNPGY